MVLLLLTCCFKQDLWLRYGTLYFCIHAFVKADLAPATGYPPNPSVRLSAKIHTYLVTRRVRSWHQLSPDSSVAVSAVASSLLGLSLSLPSLTTPAKARSLTLPFVSLASLPWCSFSDGLLLFGFSDADFPAINSVNQPTNEQSLIAATYPPSFAFLGYHFCFRILNHFGVPTPTGEPNLPFHQPATPTNPI